MAMTNAERQKKLRDKRKSEKEIDEAYIDFLKKKYGSESARELKNLSMSNQVLQTFLNGQKFTSYDNDVRNACQKLDYLRLVVFKDFDSARNKKTIYDLKA